MRRKWELLCLITCFLLISLSSQSQASIRRQINAHSAILIDMDNGAVLFEQNADAAIPPASITKILTLYLVFEAIKEGQVHLSDRVEVSRRAASTGGSRMGLKAGTTVSLEELIKGMAVVSGNDACVAAAEHISGSVDRFVSKMNAKASSLGMRRSRFMTPNGLPASGQVTTARDISKLSIAYLHRFPESLSIHSMQSYTYGKSSHHNANRLLGKCIGVDGLKTGFVCASGYNISATAKRNGTRVLAVVMGAKNPWIRLAETEKLIEAGFRECGAPCNMKLASSMEDPVCNVVKDNGVRGPSKIGTKGRKAQSAISKPIKGKRSTRISVAPAKKTKSTASREPAKSNKGQAAVALARSKSGKATGKGSCAVTKSSVEKSAKSTRLSKSQKLANSSKKQQAKTSKVAKKKTSSKTAPHADASRKKPKG